MRILHNWQYRYIERCLYGYQGILDSNLDTEQQMAKAITLSKDFFKDTTYGVMLEEYYFNADIYRKKYTPAGHYSYVCEDLLCMEKSNGYAIRREIIYRVAMYCYALGLFRI